MAYTVAEAEVRVGINDAGMLAGLKKVEAQVDKTLKNIDRKEATAKIDGDMIDLDRKIKEAEAKIAKLDASKAEIEIEGDTSDLDAAIESARAHLATLKDEKVDLTFEKRELQQIQKEWALAEKRVEAYNKAQEQTARLSEKAAKEQDAFNRMHSRALRENLHYQEEQEVAVGRLRTKYAQLYTEQRRIEESQTRLGKLASRISGAQDPRLRQLAAEIDLVTKKLADMGEGTKGLNRDIDHHRRGILAWGQSLGAVRVHLGFFSLSLKQLGIAGFAFGHVISSLVAAASALVGSIGAGLVGALGLGAAGFAATAGAAFGFFQIMQPLVEEIGTAQDAIEAYDKAVLQYGKNSTQAETAQKKMNHTLAGTSAEARKAISSATTLGDRWEKLAVDPSRGAFFETYGQGLKTVNALMPMFAKNSVQAFDAAASGAQRWLRSLRSQEAQNAIDETMDNLTQAIPSIMRGLGSLGAAFGRIIASFSRHFGPTADTFADWADGIDDATKNASELDDKVDGLMSHTRSLGRLLTSAGRLIAQFFKNGADEGQGLLDSITEQFNQWTRWMQSVEGENRMDAWFSHGISETRKWGQVLGNMIDLFSDISRALQPVAAALSQILVWVTSIKRAIESIPVIGGTLIKVAGFAGAAAIILSWIGKIRMGLVGLGLLGGGAAAAGGAAAGGGALAGLLSRFGGLARLAGPIGIATGAAVALGSAFKGSAEHAKEVAQVAEDLNIQVSDLNNITMSQGFEDLRDAANEAAEAVDGAVDSINRTDEAQAEAKKGWDEYRQAVEKFGRNSPQAQRALYNATNLSARANGKLAEETDKVAEAYDKADSAVEEARDNLRGFNEEARRQSKIGIPDADPGKTEAQIAAEKELADAQNRRRAVLIDLNRAQANSQPLLDKSREAVGKFSRAFKDVPKVQKLLVQTNSAKAVGDLAKVANESKRLSGRKATLNVIANADNAFDAINDLRNQNIAAKRLNVLDNVGGVINKIERLTGIKLPPKIQQLAEKGGAAVISMIEQITGRKINTKSFSIVAQDRATSVIGTVINMLAGVRSKTVTLTTIERRINTGRAEGGSIFPAAKGMDVGLMQRAHDRASQHPSLPTGTSRKISKPTILTGEETAHPEYVIATNPAYRKRNLNYLSQAANSLGAAVITMKKKGGPIFGPRSKYEALRHKIDLSESLYGNQERSYSETLSASGIPNPGLETLKETKRNSIQAVQDLIKHITNSMLRRLKGQIKDFRKMDKPRKGDGKGYRERYQNKKARANEAKDSIPELKREKDDLLQEQYGLKLDLDALEQGRITPGGAGGGGVTPGVQEGQLNAARLALFRDFASNFRPIAASLGASGVGRFGTGFGAQLAPASSGGGGNTFINNFAAPPPDPHTWTEGVAWEAGAVG